MGLPGHTLQATLDKTSFPVYTVSLGFLQYQSLLSPHSGLIWEHMPEQDTLMFWVSKTDREKTWCVQLVH